MSQGKVPGVHSDADMRRLKAAALPSRDENLSAPTEMNRRDAMRVFMAASSALALGLGGCERKPKRHIISRVSGPEYQRPGKALYYSSTFTDGPNPYGMVIKTVDGRPIKVDGNPDHPVAGGASTSAMQASVLSLYDPQRLRAPSAGGSEITWQEADHRIVEALKGAGSVVLITRSTLGPSEQAIVEAFASTVPGAQHFVHEAIHDEPRRSAWHRLYGDAGTITPRFDAARVIVSFDSDFLATDGHVLANIQAFAKGRTLDDHDHHHAQMSRLYVVEGAMTVTGSNADHRIRTRPSAMAQLAQGVLEAIDGNAGALTTCAQDLGISDKLLSAMVDDLKHHPGQALVVAGPHLPPAVHDAVAIINEKLGAHDKTLQWTTHAAALPISRPADIESALGQNPDVAILLDVNPVYDWPGKNFAPLLAKAKLTVGHGLYMNETLAACSLALPSCHNLESWNDAAPQAGFESVCQPVIAPLYDCRQSAESMLTWTQAASSATASIRGLTDWHAFVRHAFSTRHQTRPTGDLGHTTYDRWERALSTGIATSVVPTTTMPAVNRAKVVQPEANQQPPSGLEVVVHPHHAVYDGRFAENGWLQELPDPVSKLVWDNVAAISPATAASLGVREGDLVSVTAGDATVTLPALIQPGNADGLVSLTLGHGRQTGGPIALEAGGANVARLMGHPQSSSPFLASGVKIAKAGGARKLVRTQKEFSRHDRPIVLDGTLAEYREDPGFVAHKKHTPEPISMYPEYDYSQGHKWAMAIDLGVCIGCSTCVIACQAENNIPIVTRDECAKGREMHWIRIDRYVDGDEDDQIVHQQPMLCQQCDNAPCESVCPVNATAHSPEGLNEMAYNRCVGTRYCANNCPYKVRRFNFLRYQQAQLKEPVQELMFNPQVTVRGVGVMEKCTFCVQRINEAKYQAKQEGVALADGAVRTACQQACPSGAIVFGDLNDPNSDIAKMHADKRAFFVLEELNIKPNVAYLARVRNPNPALHEPHTKGGHH